MPKLFVQFMHGQENRQTEWFGPFTFIQLTYADLRIGMDGKDDEEFGCIGEDGMWYLASAPSGPAYSDVIINAE